MFEDKRIKILIFPSFFFRKKKDYKFKIKRNRVRVGVEYFIQQKLAMLRIRYVGTLVCKGKMQVTCVHV